MNLTAENYYSREASLAYMSCSDYQGWLGCEAKQAALLDGRWVDKGSSAFLVGNYFHSYFEGAEAHERFCDEHFYDIFKTKTTKARGEEITGKYAEFVEADKMIDAAQRDPLIKGFIDIPGENEKIMTGELFGLPWRIRVDKYIADARIILDWKTTKDIWATSYNPATKERETFVEAYGYMMRAAVYSEIEKQFTGNADDPQFVIIAISKQDPPDKEALLLNHRQRYDWELEQIKNRVGRIQMLRDGVYKPERCGFCDYCRATKRLYTIRPYYKLAPEWREGREEENDVNSGPVLAEAQEPGELECMPTVPEAAQVGAGG